MSTLFKEGVISGKGVKVKGVLTLGEINSDDKRGTDFVSTLIAKRDSLVEDIAKLEAKKEDVIKSTEEEVANMLKKAQDDVARIERKAYTEGHAQGLSNGYDDGYKEAYDDNIEKAKLEASAIVENANSTLRNINNTVYEYLLDSKEDIMKLCMKISTQVLKEELQNPYTMARLVEKALQDYKYKSNCVIKVNKQYVDTLKEKVSNWKVDMRISEDIFIIEDDNIEEGNAIIESDRGKVIVGLDTALERLKNELL